MRYLSNILRIRNKKAVSPIIAAILLIGLVVIAGGALIAIVLPMLSTSPDIQVIDDASFNYAGNFLGHGEVSLTNAGNGAGDISSAVVEYYDDTTSTWQAIPTNPQDTFPVTISSLAIYEFEATFDSNESLNKDETYRIKFTLEDGSELVSGSGSISKLRSASISGTPSFTYATGKGTASGIRIFNEGRAFTTITDVRVISNMTDANMVASDDLTSAGYPYDLEVNEYKDITIPFSTIDVDENGFSEYYFEVDVLGEGTFSTEQTPFLLTNPGFEFQNAIWQDSVGDDDVPDRVRLDINTDDEDVNVDAIYVYAYIYDAESGSFSSNRVYLEVAGDNGTQVLSANSLVNLYINFDIGSSGFPGTGIVKLDVEIDLPDPKTSIYASDIGDDVTYLINNTFETDSYSKTVTTDNTGETGSTHLGCETADFEIMLSANYDGGASREDLDADNILDGTLAGSNGWLSTTSQGSSGNLHFNITFLGSHSGGAWISTIDFYFDGDTSWGRLPATMLVYVDNVEHETTWVPNENGYYTLPINMFGVEFSIWYPTMHTTQPDGTNPSYGPMTGEIFINSYSAFAMAEVNLSSASELNQTLVNDNTGTTAAHLGCETDDFEIQLSHNYDNGVSREDLDADQMIYIPTDGEGSGTSRGAQDGFEATGNQHGWLVTDAQGDAGVHFNITLIGDYASGALVSSITLWFDALASWGENPREIYLVLDGSDYIWVDEQPGQNLQGSFTIPIGRYATEIMVVYYSSWDDGSYGPYTTGLNVTILTPGLSAAMAKMDTTSKLVLQKPTENKVAIIPPSISDREITVERIRTEIRTIFIKS
ncbi:MAG: archaellin/type IV pilin N-terminal domain-containing protein [Candidatus Hodarchaeales archaeon]